MRTFLFLITFLVGWNVAGYMLERNPEWLDIVEPIFDYIIILLTLYKTFL